MTSSKSNNNNNVISIEELEIHSKKEDAWIALNGKVFDVSFYVNSHPGGVSTISKGFGKDATALFNSVHPYVDFEKILTGKQVGLLKSTENPVDKPSGISKLEKSSGWTSCFCCCKKASGDVPQVEMYDSKTSLIFVINFTHVPNVHAFQSDWTVGVLNKETLIVRKVVDRSNVFVIQLKLTKPLTDDTIHVTHGDGWRSLEVTLSKPDIGQKWKILGKPDGDNNLIVDSRATKDSFNACIAYKQTVAKHTYMFGFRLTPSALYGIPIGFHLYVYINGKRKPYTPVCYSLMRDEDEPQLGGGPGQLIWCIIKIYPQGELTALLDKIPVNKSDTPEWTLTLSPPGGNFSLEWLIDRNIEVLILMAGGTGITPMARIIHWCLQKVRKGLGSKHVLLLYWNKTEEDIIWNEKWEELNSEEFRWFHYFPILTQPGPKWDGLIGRPTNKQIQNIIDTLAFEVSNSSSKHGMICGPSGFNTSVEEAIGGILTLDNVHVFAG